MSSNRSMKIEEVLEIILETVQGTAEGIEQALTLAKEVATLTAQVVDILKNSGVTLVPADAGNKCHADAGTRSLADRARVTHIIDTLLSAPQK